MGHTPFLYPSLHTQHCQLTSPPLTLPLYTLTLNFFSTSSLHPLSTSPLYILSIVGYCHGTAQSPLGSPPVRRQPTLYDYPPLTLPLYLLCTPHSVPECGFEVLKT